jgi:hypothetical protein
MLSGSRNTSTNAPWIELAGAIGDDVTPARSSRSAHESSSSRSLTANARWSSPVRVSSNSSRRLSRLRQAEPDGEVVMPKEDLAASAVGRFVPVDAPEPEHLLVPRRAVLDVAHGEAKVVESSDHH